jgi:hypothetical protein
LLWSQKSRIRRTRFIQVFGLGRFDEVGVGAETIGVVDVAVVIGGSENDNRQCTETGLLANPLENIEAGTAREVQVQED